MARSSEKRVGVRSAPAAVVRAAAIACEALERRTLFGYYSADNIDEWPLPVGPCPPPSGNTGSVAAEASGEPVRYFDGHPFVDAADLSSGGFGSAWDHRRSWTGTNNASLNGNGWSIEGLPYVVVAGGTNGSDEPFNNIGGGVLGGTGDDDRLSVVSGGTSALSFSIPNSSPYSSYPAWSSHRNTLERVSDGGSGFLLRLIDDLGNVTEFYDVRRDGNSKPVTGSLANDRDDKYGRFKSYTSANGTTTVEASYDLNGYPTATTRKDTSSNTWERYVYTYADITNDLVTAASGVAAKLIASVTLERTDNAGSNWRQVRRVDYNYYTGRLWSGSTWVNDTNGRLGDLKLASVNDPATKLTVSGLTRSGSTATATSNGHGYGVGQIVVMAGANEQEYNGTFVVTAVTSNSFSYTINGTPATPATGTITANKPIDVSYYRYYKFTGESYYYGQPGGSSVGPTNNSATTGGPDPVQSDESFPYDADNPYANDALTMSGLKSVVTGAAFNRLVANYANYHALPDSDLNLSTDDNGDGDATNDSIKTYVNNFFEYERWADHIGENGGDHVYWRTGYRFGSRYRVTKEFASAEGCSTCSSGLGEYTFEYVSNDTATHIGLENHNYNTWRVRTTEYLPDTTSDPTDNDRNIVYTNEFGQAILKVLVDANGTSSTSDDKVYSTYFQYDSLGRLVLKANPSAVAAYDPANPSSWENYLDLAGFNGTSYANLNDSDGLIEVYEYATSTTATSTTAGDVAGYIQNTKTKRGETGTAVTLNTRTYISRTTNGVTVFPLATDTVYRNDNGTGAQTTNYSYTWHAGTNEIKSKTVTYPTVTTAQNGPNSADVETTVYDIYGRPVWQRDGEGFITRTQYDLDTGGMTERVVDVNTATTSDSLIQQGVTGLTRSGSTATATLNDHGYRAGEWVRISGANESEYNGTFQITAVTTNTFAYTVAGTPTTPATGTIVVAWGTPAGGGLQLVTSHVVDDLGRATKITDANGNVDYIVYRDAEHETRVYRGWQTGTNTTTGPIEVTREHRPLAGASAGQRTVYTESLTTSAPPATTSNQPNGSETISAANIQSLSRAITNDAGQVVQSDVYFSLSGVTYAQATPQLTSAAASNNSATGNYHKTLIDYDGRGRLKRVETAAGTVTRTLYDARGLVTSTWVGTDDTPTSGFWSPANNGGANMVKVASYEYDDGAATGDGNLTRATQHAGGGSANDRITSYHYDWRNRLIATKQGVKLDGGGALDLSNESAATQRQVVYRTLDNLGQVVAEERYDADGVRVGDGDADGTPDALDANDADGVPGRLSDGNRRAKTSVEYDEQGRVFRSTVHSVDQSGGSATSGGLASDVWYDRRGNVVKSSAPGGLVTKSAFDGAGREALRYVTDGGGDSVYGDADDVTGDKVLEQSETLYDANGNPILVTMRQRFHDATDTGALGNPSSSAGTAKARVNYVGMYYDAVDRLTDQADFGTNGGTLDGAGSGADLDANNNGVADRPALPGRSDTVLVTSYGYDNAGRLQDVLDPKGITDRTLYDLLGRTSQTIENVVAPGTRTDTDNRTTAYTFTGVGNVRTMTAVLPGSTIQETKYVYGATQSGGSDIDSNDILVATQYPDKSTGAASSSEQETCKVNALGEKKQCTDRAGSVHTYSYDVLGRLVADEVTTLGANVDGAVRKLGYTYDTAGRPEKSTSYNSGGTVLNEVQRAYNGLGQLTIEYQEHGTSVNTGTSPKVQYGYSEVEAGAIHSRLKTITYPNGRVLHHSYGTGGALNDKISRLEFLADDSSGSPGTHLEEYSYLGLGTVVERKHPQPSLNLTFLKKAAESTGDGGDQYTGLDRFGRVVDHRWVDLNGAGDGDDTDADRFKYAYDRNSNRVSRDVTATGAPTTLDEAYTYDNLDRLMKMNRGALASGTITDGNATYTRRWDSNGGLDALGNWDNVRTDADGGGSGSFTDQTRTHNSQNQITDIPSGATDPAYDNNGNMTGDEVGRDFVYDAWNRIVGVKDTFGSTVKTYKVDALGRRIANDLASGADTDLYYSAAWQVLEEREGSTAKVQNVWSQVYVDALVLRDLLGSGGGGGTAGALDTSFSGDGKLTVSLSAGTDIVKALVQADGKIVALGDSGGDNNVGLARANVDGTLDTTFDGPSGTGNGAFSVDFGGSDRGRGIALQSDGKIVICGTNGSDVILGRFNTDGSLDSTFGSAGKVVQHFDGTDTALDLAIQADGKIVICGTANNNILVARFNADGSLDTTYATNGGDGWESFNTGGTDQGWQMTLDQDGKAVLGGDTTNTIATQDIVIIRLNTDGTFDNSFDGNGVLRTSFTSGQDGLRGIEVDDSNRIVIAGKGGGDFQVARLTTSGALDTTFDADGKQSVNINGTDDADALVIDGSGRIIVAGSVNGSKDFGVVRLTSAGALDTAFDTDGKQTIDFSGGTVTEEGEALMLQSDGKIVVAGQTGGDFAIARLHAETGSSDVRHYAVQDANFNVTAIAASADATVLERFLYDPYGSATVLDPNFAVDPDGVSDYGWAYLHQGGRYDADSGLYHFRHRDYSPTLGRWVQQDPLRYVDGMNVYQGMISNPCRFFDPWGQSIEREWPGQFPRNITPEALDKIIKSSSGEAKRAAQKAKKLLEQVERLKNKGGGRNLPGGRRGFVDAKFLGADKMGMASAATMLAGAAAAIFGSAHALDTDSMMTEEFERAQQLDRQISRAQRELRERLEREEREERERRERNGEPCEPSSRGNEFDDGTALA